MSLTVLDKLAVCMLMSHLGIAYFIMCNKETAFMFVCVCVCVCTVSIATYVVCIRGAFYPPTSRLNPSQLGGHTHRPNYLLSLFHSIQNLIFISLCLAGFPRSLFWWFFFPGLISTAPVPDWRCVLGGGADRYTKSSWRRAVMSKELLCAGCVSKLCAVQLTHIWQQCPKCRCRTFASWRTRPATSSSSPAPRRASGSRTPTTTRGRRRRRRRRRRREARTTSPELPGSLMRQMSRLSLTEAGLKFLELTATLAKN